MNDAADATEALPRSGVATTARGRVAAVRGHLLDPLFRNAYALAASTAVSTGLGLGYWVLAARFYEPADVGRGSALISVMVLLAGVAQLNLMPALTRFLPCAGPETAPLVRTAYVAAAATAVVVATAFLGATHGLWPESSTAELFGSGWPLAALFVAAVAGWVVFTLQDSVMTGLRRAVWALVDNSVYGVAKIAGLVVLAGALPDLGVFVSWVVPALCSVVVVTFLAFRRAIPAHVRESVERWQPVDRARIRRFVAGDYAGALFELAVTRLLPLVVVARAGVEAAGYFYVVWVLGTALELLVVNFGASLTVEGAISQDRLAGMALAVVRRVGLLLLPLALLVVCLPGPLLAVFGSDYVDNGAPLLRLLGLALVPRLVITLTMAVARVRGRIGQVLAIQAAFATLVLALALVLVGPHGIAGVGIAYLAAGVVVGGVLAPGMVTFLRSGASPHPAADVPVAP